MGEHHADLLVGITAAVYPAQAMQRGPAKCAGVVARLVQRDKDGLLVLRIAFLVRVGADINLDAARDFEALHKSLLARADSLEVAKGAVQQ